MTKKENVLEKCRINLDKEKVLHSITRVKKEELQQRIDKAIQILEEQLPIWRDWHYDGCEVDSYIVEIIELLKGE